MRKMFLFKNLLRFSTLKLNQLGVEWNVNSFSCFSLDAINIDFCTAQNHALKHHVAHLISLWRARRVIQYILTLCCFYPCSSESFVTKESELFMRCRTKRREIWNLIPLNASLKRALTQHSSRLQRTIFWLIEGFQTCLASWIVTYFVKIFRLLTISAFSCIFFEFYEINLSMEDIYIFPLSSVKIFTRFSQTPHFFYFNQFIDLFRSEI